MMKAFVTGSTGLLGNNLVHLLVEQGYEVKALARSAEKAQRLLSDTGAEIVIGDMEDVAGFADQLKGCDVLFHTAAYFREYYQPGEHWEKLKRINVDGTIQLLEAAEACGVKKVIYVSSGGVVAQTGGSNQGKQIDESAPYSDFGKRNLYFQSKVVAEKSIYAFLENHSLPVILILPGWILGPRDAAPTGSGRLILNYLEQKLPALFDGGNNAVDARDVAQAMINAVEHGQSGERYLVAGRHTKLADMMAALENLTGIPAPRRYLPPGVMLVYAWFSENLARLTGDVPLVTQAAIHALNDRVGVSSKKAEKELGVAFRPIADTLRDEVAWFRAQGYV